MKKMSKGMLMTALICGAVYLGGSPVYASELQEFALDEYVVTAARTETKLVDTPANISVVDAQTIEERHYQDVSEVLKDVPGANIVDTGVGAYEKTIRLNGDDRVLILVDGRKVNVEMGPTSGGRANFDMNQLPDVNMIERIEVLKGGGGALYGSDAVGGVVNIITKKANSTYGKVSVGYGSMGAKDYNATYSIKEGKTGVSVSASKYEQDYYKYNDISTNSTKRWPLESSFTSNKVSLKLLQEINDNSNLTIGYDYSKFDGLCPDLNNSLNKLEKENNNIYSKYDWTLNNEDLGFIQVYRNEYDYTNLGIVSPYGYYSVGYMTDKTTGVDMQQELTLSKNNKMVVGASYKKSDVKTKGDNTYDESINNIAIFVSDSWQFAPSWTLNTGARYDDHSEVGNETTFSAGINKKFDDNSHIYLNWSEVFKAPTVDDLYYNCPGMGEGNINLKPEKGDTWTLGYGTKINDNTEVGINYFESSLDDAIDWSSYESSPGWWISKVDNIQKQKKKGLEFTVNHKFNDNLSSNFSYTYLNVKNNLNDNGYIKDWNYIPNTYRVGLNYNDGKWDTNLWLRAGTGGATHTWIDKYGSNKVSYLDSSYVTVDFAVTYKATKDLSFYAKGYNLFNEAYAEFAGTSNGSYNYPAQSRRFIVGAEYKF